MPHILDTSSIMPTRNDIRNNIRLPKKLSRNLAYVCGVLAGDGSIRIQRHKYNYTIKCVGNPKDEREFYNQVLTELFSELFNYKIKPKLLDSKTTYGFEFACKSLVLFFTQIIGLPNGRKDDIEIPKVILANRKLTRAFIQGFADTDFCLALKRRYKSYQYYPVVTGVSKSKTIIDQMSQFLTLEGLNVSRHTRHFYDKRFSKTEITYAIDISGHNQLVKWMQVIGFRHPKHLGKFELWKARNKNNKRAFPALLKIKKIAEAGISSDKISYPNLNSPTEY